MSKKAPFPSPFSFLDKKIVPLRQTPLVTQLLSPNNRKYIKYGKYVDFIRFMGEKELEMGVTQPQKDTELSKKDKLQRAITKLSKRIEQFDGYCGDNSGQRQCLQGLFTKWNNELKTKETQLTKLVDEEKELKEREEDVLYAIGQQNKNITKFSQLLGQSTNDTTSLNLRKFITTTEVKIAELSIELAEIRSKLAKNNPGASDKPSNNLC